EALSVLASFLSQGEALGLDVADLTRSLNRVVAKFKEQSDNERLSKEAIAFIERKEMNKARHRIQRVRNAFNYFEAAGHDDEAQQILRTLRHLFTQIEECTRWPASDPRHVKGPEILILLEPLKGFDFAESLLKQPTPSEALLKTEKT